MLRVNNNLSQADVIINLGETNIKQFVVKEILNNSKLLDIKVLVELSDSCNINHALILIAETRKLMAYSSRHNQTVTFLTNHPELFQLLDNVINRSKIVCLGDSITFGYPWGPYESWVNIAAKRTGKTIINKGINGDTTTDMLLRFTRDVISNKPSYVHIMGGINDAWQLSKPNTVINNIKEMISLAIVNGICPIISLPTPINPRGRNFFGNLDNIEKLLFDYKKQFVELSSKNNVPVINYNNVLCQTNSIYAEPAMFYDQGHPNKAGYLAIANLFSKKINLIVK